MLNKIVLFSSLMLAVNSTLASADEYPNLMGTWISTDYPGGAYFGDGNHTPDKKEPMFTGDDIVWTLVIEKQKDAGLIGTWSTNAKIEKLVGVIRRDRVSLLLADEDNQFEGTLITENEIELCAVDSGDFSTAACIIVTRQ